MLEERPVADDLAFPPRMYQVADPQVVAQGGRALLKRRIRAHVSRTVLLLGVTSMLTDISSEMVTTILPLYLVYSLGMSPLQFGVIDGIQQGASSLVRVFGGFFADRRGRYKEVAVVGYGLSAFTRIALLVAGRSWSLIGGVIFLDRTGKGIRTAPRDALISLSTPEEDLGTAFGVHRALDTAGAMIGPVIAFAVLYAAPHGFHSIFVLSFCFALVGSPCWCCSSRTGRSASTMRRRGRSVRATSRHCLRSRASRC